MQPAPVEIVGLGEVLWDLLPGGKQLGGAPFNFTFHCHRLGACPRIGRRSPKISLDSLGFGLSASAQPSARTAPLNVRRRSRRDARSSEDCA
jgi:hypothetical protein